MLPSLILALTIVGASAASTRVPPPGIIIGAKERAELRAGADALAVEINSLRSSNLRELLPDVQIFHKAVDWALRYDEFYRSNEVRLARSLLKQGMERAREMQEGRPSWLTATGLVVRGYVSRIDGSVQPYGMVVPATFAADPAQARRLDVWLHGRDDRLTELKFISDRQRSYGEFTPANAFVLHPYGRYCNAFKFAGEVDVFEALEQVRKSYHIDDRRIALRGFSMGGAGAWHLAAHHPDVWVVAAPGAGFAETAEYQKLGANLAKIPWWERKLWQLYDATDYAANFSNLPVVAYNGTIDPQRQAADVMERAMKAEGLTLPRVWGTNVGHKYTSEGKREVSQFVDEAVAKGKDTFPPRLHLSTRTLRYNATGFDGGPGMSLSITSLREHWKRADLEADVADTETWLIRTTNVNAFSIRKVQTTMPRLPHFVKVNGQELTAPWTLVERTNATAWLNVRRDANGRWAKEPLPIGDATPTRLEKQSGLQGPIDDAFMDSFLVVRPTGAPRSASVGAWITTALAKATNDWRAQFRGAARVTDDSHVTDSDIAANNLVLFGDPQSNKLLARIANKLPIEWTADSVRVGGQSFDVATHVPVFIFPNPLNPRRYVVLNSGFTFADAGTASNARQTPKLPDYAVFNVARDAVVFAGFFDEQWQFR